MIRSLPLAVLTRVVALSHLTRSALKRSIRRVLPFRAGVDYDVVSKIVKSIFLQGLSRHESKSNRNRTIVRPRADDPFGRRGDVSRERARVCGRRNPQAGGRDGSGGSPRSGADEAMLRAG